MSNTSQRIVGCICSITMLLSAQCQAAADLTSEVELFEEPTGFSLRVPDERINMPYASTGREANWTITAWHIPTGRLSDFRHSAKSPQDYFLSTSGQTSVEVQLERNRFTNVLLRQSGERLPCTLENGKAREFDFFMHPNSKNNTFEHDGFRSTVRDVSLADVETLSLHADVSAMATDNTTPGGCDVNQGSVLLALVLVNRLSKQTLFYQLALMEICGNNLSLHDRLCGEKKEHPIVNIFSNHSPFGVDDKLPLLGIPFIAQGERRKFIINVMPRIVKFIMSDDLSIDKDLSHWSVNGMTAGQNIWGGINLQSRWGSMGARVRLR